MKKNKREQKAAPVPAPEEPLLEKGTWAAVAAGVVLSAAGFWVLSKSDPAGQNWASHLSPFLILGGYAAVGIALWKNGK